jgi:hypothetical protein
VSELAYITTSMNTNIRDDSSASESDVCTDMIVEEWDGSGRTEQRVGDVASGGVTGEERVTRW